MGTYAIINRDGEGFQLTNPADVQRIPFGTITLNFSDRNSAGAEVDTVLPQFDDVILVVKKLLEGLCP